MLVDPDDDVLYVFHDPEQALYRDDVVGTLGLPEFYLDWNCRNTGPIHRFAAGYAPGLAAAEVLRSEEGRGVEVVTSGDTLEALRKVLHRLVVEERLAPLADRRADGGAAVAQRGLEAAPVRQPGALERLLRRLRGTPSACPPMLAPTSRPTRSCATPSAASKASSARSSCWSSWTQSDRRLAQLMYVGSTRARQHLVVIGA